MNVILISNDGIEFPVSEKAAFRSTLVKNMVEDVGDDGDRRITFPVVAGQTMEKGNAGFASLSLFQLFFFLVVEYIVHHVDDVVAAETNDDVVDDDDDSCVIDDAWDKKFIDMSSEDLTNVLNAANYLDIYGLVILGCKKLAERLNELPVEKIREILDIPELPESVRKQREEDLMFIKMNEELFM